MATTTAVTSAAVIALALGGCTDAVPDMTSGPGGKADGDFDDFLAELYCEPDTGVCIAGGDLALAGEEGVRSYYAANHTAPGALTVFREEEVDKLWNKLDRFELTYCISTTEFTAAEHAELVEAFAAATAEWEAAAYVDFRYVPAEDSRCTLGTTRVRFPVIKAPPDATYIARAFFPHYKPEDTAIRMQWSELAQLRERYPEASLTGILRHELGHTLGFRHEHIRPENTSYCDEPATFRSITAYDRRSTMHYPWCDGEGDWSLQLTELDRIGAAFFYPNYDRYSGDRCPGAELRSDGTVNAACTPIVHELLELANTASLDVLDNYVRLDRRAATNIVNTRGTQPFTTLASLDAVAYVGPTAVRRMYDYLYVDGRCPQEVDLDGLIDTRCRPVVHRLLELANTATELALDTDIGLDSRAAANIITSRPGNPFTSLVELWAIPYVKTTALKQMYEYLY